MSLIRGSSLQGFDDLVREHGGDLDGLLALARIPAAAVGNQDAFISDRAVMIVLESAAVAMGMADFGRQLALRQGLEILGPVGIAARTAATVGDALAAVDEYLVVYSPALSARVEWRPDERIARFEWRVLTRRPPVHVQAAELGLGVSLRIYRLLAGPAFTPTTVHLRHKPQGPSDDYLRYFACPVTFESSFTGFTFDGRMLRQPLAADGDVHEVVRQYLAGMSPPTDAPALEPVRLLLRRLLPTGAASLGVVADNLALHPRTLQRRLADRGTSFAALVDDVRHEEAHRYLTQTTMPLSQLAGLLGYSEQSVLTRSCRRWFGVAPLAYRRTSGWGT